MFCGVKLNKLKLKMNWWEKIFIFCFTSRLVCWECFCFVLLTFSAYSSSMEFTLSKATKRFLQKISKDEEFFKQLDAEQLKKILSNPKYFTEPPLDDLEVGEILVNHKRFQGKKFTRFDLYLKRCRSSQLLTLL